MAGADRASLGSAVGQIIMHDRPVAEAQKSFWLGYGHACWGECQLEQVLSGYKPFAKQMSFEQWLDKYYWKE